MTEAILNGQNQIGINVLVGLQQNNRALARRIQQELDMELLDIGFGVRDFNIIGINYPENVQRMAERVAAQAFVGDVGRYAAINMADGLANSQGGNVAGLAAQFAMGNQLAQQMNGAINNNQQPQQQPAGDRFCPHCRKMVASKFCPDCGTQTV